MADGARAHLTFSIASKKRMARSFGKRPDEPVKRECHQTGDRLRSSFLSGRCARDRAPVDAAREKFGLKKFPVAGKTGTAYDFTDALFAGYTDSITCAVWAGFDKPQKIYRGAFGGEIALPIWVDVMNAVNDRYPAKEIARPGRNAKSRDLFEVGIARDGQVLRLGKSRTAKRSTVARLTWRSRLPRKLPTEPCNVHGEAKARLVRDLPNSGFPRASLAVDPTKVSPVAVKGPVLLAENDPYNSVNSTVRPSSRSPTRMRTCLIRRKPILKARPSNLILRISRS